MPHPDPMILFLQASGRDRHGEFARQNQKYVLIVFCLPESNRRMAAALPGEESNARLRHLAHNLEGESKPEKVFFIWIRCNPLKSPDSDERIQGNPSIFPWFYLVQLGFAWTEFARKLYLRSLGSVQLRPPADLPTRPARSTAPSRRPGASPSRSARRQSAASAPAPRRRGGTPRRACGPSRDPVLPRRG
jgi:hypothetical protein